MSVLLIIIEITSDIHHESKTVIIRSPNYVITVFGVCRVLGDDRRSLTAYYDVRAVKYPNKLLLRVDYRLAQREQFATRFVIEPAAHRSAPVPLFIGFGRRSCETITEYPGNSGRRTIIGSTGILSGHFRPFVGPLIAGRVVRPPNRHTTRTVMTTSTVGRSSRTYDLPACCAYAFACTCYI